MALVAVLERFQTNLPAHQFQTFGAHGFHYAMRTPHAVTTARTIAAGLNVVRKEKLGREERYRTVISGMEPRRIAVVMLLPLIAVY